MLQQDYSEDTIQQPEKLIQSALDALAAHIAILDEDGYIIGVNAAWCRFADTNDYGKTDYGIGTNYLDVCDASLGKNSKEASFVSKGIRDVINNRLEEFRLEYPCHSKSQKRWFVMRVIRFVWHGRNRLIVAHQNMTELKTVQVELSENQKRLQTILDNVINGIVTLNTQGIIESINPAGANIFGYDIQTMIGRSVDMFLPAATRPASMTELLKILQNGSDHEMMGIRQDNTEFHMYFAISPVILGNRKIFTGIIQDVTDRKQVEAERPERERLSLELDQEREMCELKNRFITMMSHELRTPLASIRLSSDLLKRYGDQAPPEKKNLYIDNIGMQVELLTDLIRDVTTISRGESSNTRIMPEKTDLVGYCRGIADEFRLTHHETHTIIFSSQHQNIFGMVDRKLMRQVFSNLISNALKYSPQGGEVIVYVSNGGRNAKIRVSDSGIGIPQEDLKHLFEPFHRASNTDNMPGTGLGLAIAKQAIELHNGRIKVESEVNIGTSITVSLPIHLE